MKISRECHIDIHLLIEVYCLICLYVVKIGINHFFFLEQSKGLDFKACLHEILWAIIFQLILE